MDCSYQTPKPDTSIFYSKLTLVVYNFEELIEYLNFFMSPEAILYYNEGAIESIHFKIYFLKNTECLV